MGIRVRRTQKEHLESKEPLAVNTQRHASASEGPDRIRLNHIILDTAVRRLESWKLAPNGRGECF